MKKEFFVDHLNSTAMDWGAGAIDFTTGDGLGHMGSLACNLQCIEAYVNFSAQAC